MQRFVIVGGGLAGLTAANALAGGDREVVLLEQSAHLGGRGRTEEDRGYLLNLGPHALHRRGAAANTLRRWDVPVPGEPPDTSAASFFVRGGRMYPLVFSTRGLLTTRLFSPREKFQAARILHQMASSRAAEGESFEAWLEQRARSPRVRQFAAMLIRVAT